MATSEKGRSVAVAIDVGFVVVLAVVGGGGDEVVTGVGSTESDVVSCISDSSL